MWETALSDLIEKSPYIANLKDAQTGQYIQDNLVDVKCLGLEFVDQAQKQGRSDN